MVLRRWFVGSLLLLTLASAQDTLVEPDEGSADGKPSYLGAGIDFKSGAFILGLIDANGALLQKAAGSGLEWAPINLGFFQTNTDSPNLLDLRINGLGLFHGGVADKISLNDLLTLFHSGENAFNLGYGGEWVLMDLKPKALPQLQTQFHLQGTVAKDEGQSTRTGYRGSIELRASWVIASKRDRLRDLTTYRGNLRPIDMNGDSARAIGSNAEEDSAQAESFVSATLKGGPQDDQSQEFVRAVVELLRERAPSHLASLAALNARGDNDPLRQGVQAVLRAIAAARTGVSRNPPSPRQWVDANARAVLAVTDTAGMTAAARNAWRFQGRGVTPLGYAAARARAEPNDPRLSVFLQGYAWMGDDTTRPLGFLSLNVLWSMGFAAGEGSLQPGLGVSVLVGDLPTGTSAQPTLRVQLAVPFR